jgi:hypothetical protein
MQDARRARQARRFLIKGLSLTSFRAEDGEHLRLHMTNGTEVRAGEGQPPIGALGKNRTVF